MQRQKIQQRENFTDDERYEVARKSNGYCAHCGKRIEFGGQATVDHFIPLSKGGVNAAYNRVMLCRNCNQTKADRIYNPRGYLKFLNDEDLKKLTDYYKQSYVKSFDFLGKHCLIAADAICAQLLPENSKMLKEKKLYQKSRSKITMPCAQDILIQRALPEDKEDLVAWYATYFKKFGYAIEAFDFVDFWYTFGTMYICKMTGEIKLVFPGIMSEIDPRTYGLTLFINSMYGHERYIAVARQIIYNMVSAFKEEQDLVCVPVQCVTFDKDPMTYLLTLTEYEPLRSRYQNIRASFYIPGVMDLTHDDFERYSKEASDLISEYITDSVKLGQYLLEHESIRFMEKLFINQYFCRQFA